MFWRRVTAPQIRIHSGSEFWAALVFLPGKPSRPSASLLLHKNTSNAQLVMQSWLGDNITPKTRLNITVANSLCRFWMSPASSDYLPQADQSGLAWHSFQSHFGPSRREEWRIWMAERHYRQPQFAVAVPEPELDIFKPWLNSAYTRIQPWFTACWDSPNPNVRTPWVIQTEDDRFLLARHYKGNIHEIHWRPSSQLLMLSQTFAPYNLTGMEHPHDLSVLSDAVADPADHPAFQQCLLGVR